MAHKKKHSPPVPASNQPASGPADAVQGASKQPRQGEVASAQEQDPKRRLGDFSGTAEHPRQQPSRLNDGEQHRK